MSLLSEDVAVSIDELGVSDVITDDIGVSIDESSVSDVTTDDTGVLTVESTVLSEDVGKTDESAEGADDAVVSAVEAEDTDVSSNVIDDELVSSPWLSDNEDEDKQLISLVSPSLSHEQSSPNSKTKSRDENKRFLIMIKTK